MSLVIVTGRWPAMLNLRRAELFALGAALFVQSGAVFTLLAMQGGAELTASGQAMLRQLCLPGYLLAVVLLWWHAGQFLIALCRSLPMLALIALPFLSVLWSISPSLSLRRAVALLFSYLLAQAIAIRMTPAQGLRIFGGMLGICMWLSLLLLAVPSLSLSPDDGALRGVFTHKNVLGWAASFSTLAAAVMVYDRAAGLRRRGLWFLFPSLACLLLSRSATGLFAAISGLALCVFYAFLKRNSGLGRSVTVLVFLLLTAAFLAFLSFYLTPLLEALGKDATLTGRVPLWAQVDTRIAARPLLGYGYQSFWSDASGEAWRIRALIEWPAIHSHNGFRDVLLNFGAVGGVIFAGLLAVTLWRGAILHCRSPDRSWLWPNVLIGQVLTINLTETSLLVQNDMQSTLTMIAILWVALRWVEVRRGAAVAVAGSATGSDAWSDAGGRG